MSQPQVAGYVRISRVSGREGASFISPAVQRATIERLAQAHGLELVQVVEELDVSGKVSIEERQLGRLVERIERGELAGLVVWRVSRFSRSLVDGVTVADRIARAGGRILGEDLDTASGMGKAVLGFLLGFAEEELDARRKGWREAQRRAAEDGRWLVTVPFGYDLGPDKRLVPNDDAPIVAQAYKMRASGKSYGAVADYINAHSSAPRMADRNIRQLLAKQVYLGRIVNADIIAEEKHPALIDRRTWELVQAKGTPPARTGSVAGKGDLLGLAFCTSCGSKLTVIASGPPHRRAASYRCPLGPKGGCAAPATATIALVDALVSEQLDAAAERVDLEGMLVELHDAIQAQAKAQRDLDGLLAVGVAAFDAPQDFAAAVNTARSALVQANASWANAVAAQDALARPTDAREERRELARRLIERIDIGKATRTSSGAWGPVGERVTICWRA